MRTLRPGVLKLHCEHLVTWEFVKTSHPNWWVWDRIQEWTFLNILRPCGSRKRYFSASFWIFLLPGSMDSLMLIPADWSVIWEIQVRLASHLYVLWASQLSCRAILFPMFLSCFIALMNLKSAFSSFHFFY